MPGLAHSRQSIHVISYLNNYDSHVYLNQAPYSWVRQSVLHKNKQALRNTDSWVFTTHLPKRGPWIRHVWILNTDSPVYTDSLYSSLRPRSEKVYSEMGGEEKYHLQTRINYKFREVTQLWVTLDWGGLVCGEYFVWGFFALKQELRMLTPLL